MVRVGEMREDRKDRCGGEVDAMQDRGIDMSKVSDARLG